MDAEDPAAATNASKMVVIIMVADGKVLHVTYSCLSFYTIYVEVSRMPGKTEKPADQVGYPL